MMPDPDEIRPPLPCSRYPQCRQECTWPACAEKPPMDHQPTGATDMTIRTYRKIPIELRAVQFTGDNLDEVRELTGESKFSLADDLDRENYGDDEIAGVVWDHLHSTWVGVKRGQWIMKGTEGENWPVDEAVFAKSYEPAS